MCASANNISSGSAVTVVDELGNGGNAWIAVVYQSLPCFFSVINSHGMVLS